VIKLKYKILYRRDALVTIQKTVRMHLARTQHQPRYQGIASLKKLRNQIAEVGRMAGSLKSDKDSVLTNAKKISGNVDAAIQRIKSKPDIKKTEIDQLYKTIVVQINEALADVKKKIEKQKILEEQVSLYEREVSMTTDPFRVS
jgi:myosin-6